jgi:UDP-N-acetylglucosamine acyltransferase
MIHSTAIVHPGARVASDVEIGPYAVIGDEVDIGAGSSVGSHTVIKGPTRIGRNNRIFQFVSLGDIPQDKKFQGEVTSLEIGDNNTIREFCTFNRGTVQDTGVTRIGHDNWIMAYVHVAHDCQIGSHTVFANNAQLAGHVHVGDHAILGGFTVVHQYVHIGAHAITAMGTIVLQDIPPFVTAAGNTAKPHGVNSEGLKRRGFSTETITHIKRAYKSLYRSGMSLEDARGDIATKVKECADLKLLVDFLDHSRRAIIR